MSRTVKNKPTKSLKHKRDVLKWRANRDESYTQTYLPAWW